MNALSLTIFLFGLLLCKVPTLYYYNKLCFVSTNTLIVILAIVSPLALFYIAVFSKLRAEKSSLLAQIALISCATALTAVPAFITARLLFEDAPTGFGFYYAVSLLVMLLIALLKRYFFTKK